MPLLRPDRARGRRSRSMEVRCGMSAADQVTSSDGNGRTKVEATATPAAAKSEIAGSEPVRAVRRRLPDERRQSPTTSPLQVRRDISQLGSTTTARLVRSSSRWRRRAQRFPVSWIPSQRRSRLLCSMACRSRCSVTSSATCALSPAAGREIRRSGTPNLSWTTSPGGLN